MRPVNVVDRPDLPPGTCMRCLCSKTEQRTYFVDIGVDLEYGGVAYICKMCLLDVIEHCPDLYTQRYLDQVINDENDRHEAAKAALTEKREFDEALKAIGLDASVLLENAKKMAADLQKVPTIQKEVDRLNLEVQMERVRTTEANSKLEALSQYIGSEDTIKTQQREISELALERDNLRRANGLLEETAARLAEEVANPPVNEDVAEIDEDALEATLLQSGDMEITGEGAQWKIQL